MWNPLQHNFFDSGVPKVGEDELDKHSIPYESFNIGQEFRDRKWKTIGQNLKVICVQSLSIHLTNIEESIKVI